MRGTWRRRSQSQAAQTREPSRPCRPCGTPPRQPRRQRRRREQHASSGAAAGSTGRLALAAPHSHPPRLNSPHITPSLPSLSLSCRLGGYDLHDLVVLDNTTVGVIVGVEADAVTVLTNQGRPERPDIRTCRLPDIKSRAANRRATAQDGGAPLAAGLPPYGARRACRAGRAGRP